MPSAADPVPPVTSGSTGNIIRLDRRPSRGLRRRRTPPPPLLHAEPTPQQLLAETMEAHFLARGSTLTDGPTADAYRTTLDAVQLMLDGSLAERLLGEDQHQHLSGMLLGMRDAPDEL
ncbi:hypothetical protein [Streptomyces sp. ML-6]|uniref:hypothetical protein n=1 Tax=Streptomyces sp. ML-6 TaxID=2982693 RepID=UPI0024C052FA|nr:hypothetical protein [Streptomyces sp. ML-6]MDK0525049.1 hypothetical protein [Streptomyces sp. ML-6]